MTAHPRDLVTRTIVGEDCYYDGRRVHTLSGDYAEHLADAAVTALVAAGWGDLAERSHNPNPARLEQAIADAESEIWRLRDALRGES